MAGASVGEVRRGEYTRPRGGGKAIARRVPLYWVLGSRTPSPREQVMNWDGLERHEIALALPLLVIKASGGVLACGYLNVQTFEKTGEAGAIVTGVRTFDDMLTAKVAAASSAAV